jgi:hypothetical protein
MADALPLQYQSLTPTETVPDETESSGSVDLKSLLDPAIENLRRDIESQLEAKCAALAEQQFREQQRDSERKARADAAESLLEAARRIRLEQSVTGIAVALVETALAFAKRTALFIQKEDRLLGFRLLGVADAGKRRALEQLEIPIGAASGLAHAVETSDAVVCGGGPGELSPQLAEILATTAEDRVYLFPIVLRDRVLAVLCADGDDEHPVERPAIELLVSLSEAWLEAVGTRKKVMPLPEEAAV